MQDKEILSGVADAFTDKPKGTITVQIRKPIMPEQPPTPEQPKYTWLDRLLGKPKPNPVLPEPIQPELERTITIHPCVVANSARIAGRLVLLPEEIKQGGMNEIMLPLLAAHQQDITYAVAAGVQNDRHEPQPDLIAFIEDNFDQWQLYEALHYTIEALGLQSFLNSIVLGKGVTILNPSPADESE